MFDENRFPKRMSVSFTNAVGAQLEAIAEKTNVPVAQVVRHCVDQGLPAVQAAADEFAARATNAGDQRPKAKDPQ